MKKWRLIKISYWNYQKYFDIFCIYIYIYWNFFQICTKLMNMFSLIIIINIFAKIESGKGDLQIQHVAQSNAGIAGMAASTFGRYSYHRSNTGAQVANNQQSGLGKSVSLNWKFEIANDKALVIIYISEWVGVQSKVKYRIYLTNFNRILNGIYWTITNFLLSLLASSLTRWEMSLVEITIGLGW